MARHFLKAIEEQKTLSDRVADWITEFAGSMACVVLHVVIFAVWIGWNLFAPTQGFDAYPFGLLTMIVSLEAILLSTFVMISQNRQAKHADLRAELDYEVDVEAESEMKKMLQRLDEIEAKIMTLQPSVKKTSSSRSAQSSEQSPAARKGKE